MPLAYTTSPKPKESPIPTNAKDIQHLKALVKKSDSLEEVKQICHLLTDAASTALADRAIAQETVQQLTKAQKKSKTDKKQVSRA